MLCCLPATAQLTFNELHADYDSSWTYKNLQLVPLRFKDCGQKKRADSTGKEFISFSSALSSGKISVKEIISPEGSDVGMLLMKNHSKKDVLLQSGEMVTGGKQDRVFAETQIIPASSGDNYVKVFCAEKGRWDDKPKTFSYAGTADAELRKVIHTKRRQNAIWKEIEKRYQEQGKKSPTWPYADLYKNAGKDDSSYINFFKQKYKQSDSCFAGFVSITGDKIINCELFGSSDYCSVSFESLVQSYIRIVADTGSAVPAVSKDKVQQFLDRFLQSVQQQKEYLEKNGQQDKYMGKLIHVVAYDE